MRNLLSVASVFLLLTAGCVTPGEAPAPEVDLAAERASLMQADRAWFEEYSASDNGPEAFVNRVVDDANLLPPDAPMAQGKEAIRDVIAMLEATPGFSISWSASAAEVGSAGDMGYTMGAYEIMMDDLRDYRFYEKDMLHPNQEAREYIWEKFAACYFDKGTTDFISEWGKLSKALKHKPFHPESKQHKEFLALTMEKLEKFAHLIDVSQEIDTIKSQLNEKGSQ